MLEGNELTRGIYRLKNESMTVHGNEVTKGDQIRIVEQKGLPVDEVLGLQIYEAIHVRSQQKLYITTAEITK